MRALSTPKTPVNLPESTNTETKSKSIGTDEKLRDKPHKSVDGAKKETYDKDAQKNLPHSSSSSKPTHKSHQSSSHQSSSHQSSHQSSHYKSNGTSKSEKMDRYDYKTDKTDSKHDSNQRNDKDLHRKSDRDSKSDQSKSHSKESSKDSHKSDSRSHHSKDYKRKDERRDSDHKHKKPEHKIEALKTLVEAASVVKKISFDSSDRSPD